MSDTSDCGCCAGVTSETPVGKSNPPGQGAIAYRVGTWSTFRNTMVSRLSSSDYPALAPLTTRSDDDYTVALCDAFAMLADVLTFYQERIANENYLRTATQRNSVIQLANLIGYEPSPGVAANVNLAFTLQTSPGVPAQATQPSIVPAGTRAQSVPDPGQTAQTFETVAAITARAEWNAIPAQTAMPYTLAEGMRDLYLAGTATQLNPGDAIVIVGGERLPPSTSNRWDVRWINTVATDTTNNLTHITWSKPLGGTWGTPSTRGTQVFAFRQRASLFGNNAPNPLLMNVTNSHLVHDHTWRHYHIDRTGKAVDLDSAYPKIVQGSWVALAGGYDPGGALTGYVELYNVTAVTQLSRTDFGISGKITRLSFDVDANLGLFSLPQTQVLAQSDLLALAQRPLIYPVFGSTLTLGVADANIQPAQLLAVSGKLQRVMIGPDVTGITFANDPSRTPAAGDSFMMLGAPTQTVAGAPQALTPEQLDPAFLSKLSGNLTWSLQDRNGETVAVTAPVGSLALQPALTSDSTVSEACAIVSGADGVTPLLDTTTLTLTAPLTNCYDRSTVAVNANVAPATVGQTTSEVGGSGDASQQNQSFALKQSPLTYVLDPNDPTGRSSTLAVAVNGLTWTEVPTLCGAGPTDRVYSLSQANDATTTVQFGDGVNGALLPTAQNNVRFAYRQGLGVAGNLRASQISLLLTRPLGVTGVANPAPSTGGQDPETIDDARTNAPLHVMTLDRAVSTQDYADYAATFAGIAKAYAVWISSGIARGVYVTIAGPAGETFQPTDPTISGLTASLRQYGDELLPLKVQSFTNPTFRLSATVKVAADADPNAVLPAVISALRAAYAFDMQDFGEPVTIDGVYATIQGVTGVIASDISQLYRIDTGPSQSEPQARLLAALPGVQKDGSVNPAELLTLDSGAITLGQMT
jgi:predicted phage baseplate assembly protein